MKKTIDAEVVAKLESLSYEYEARKSVIAEMLSMNMDTNTTSFEKYQKEMIEFKILFEHAKKEFEQQYVTPTGNAASWSLDYHSCELTITEI